MKCEEGGDYLEAGRAQRQLDVLRRQETRRQQKAVRARQLCERQDVQVRKISSPPATKWYVRFAKAHHVLVGENIDNVSR